ncbi:MAG: ATP-binding protein [Actinomycetota bacterium]|nr:ATP-binding protein [Actinomycetota bacterium]
MANPFHYGTPAEGKHFTGRDDELAALTSRMADGINVVLLSPRRYGKTSLHRAAQARLARSKPAPALVEVNVLKATSLATLAGMLTAATYRLPGARWQRARQAVPEFLRRVRVTPTVSFDASGVPRFGFDANLSRPDAEAVIADVYAVLADEATQRPAVLVLDEFQAITRLGPALPDLLKGMADDHPLVSLVLAGSKRHLMEELVIHNQAPLFGMAQRLALGPLPEPVMIDYLESRAGGAARPFVKGCAEQLIALVGPVPNDIQHLAYEAFELAGAQIDETAIADGMARAVGHEGALFAESLGRLSPGQGRVLAALALTTPDEPYGAGFARSVGLASGSSVRKALQPLLANEEVVERHGALAVADPFFAAWLRADGPGPD